MTARTVRREVRYTASLRVPMPPAMRTAIREEASAREDGEANSAAVARDAIAAGLPVVRRRRLRRVASRTS